MPRHAAERAAARAARAARAAARPLLRAYLPRAPPVPSPLTLHRPLHREQVKRAVSAANAQHKLSDEEKLARRKQKERERDQRRDRSKRARPAEERAAALALQGREWQAAQRAYLQRVAEEGEGGAGARTTVIRLYNPSLARDRTAGGPYCQVCCVRCDVCGAVDSDKWAVGDLPPHAARVKRVRR